MMVATLSPDRTTVTLCTGQWSETIPVSLIDRRIAFYRRLMQRERGAYARFYESDLVALEAVKRLLDAPPPHPPSQTRIGEAGCR